MDIELRVAAFCLKKLVKGVQGTQGRGMILPGEGRGLFYCIMELESPPAWTQEAYRLQRIKYSICCPVLGGGGVPPARRVHPGPDLAGGTPSLLGSTSPVRPGWGTPPPPPSDLDGLYHPPPRSGPGRSTPPPPRCRRTENITSRLVLRTQSVITSSKEINSKSLIEISMAFIVGITPQHWTNKYNSGGAARGGGVNASGGGGTGGSWDRSMNKQCPFYKKMPGKKFKVFCNTWVMLVTSWPYKKRHITSAKVDVIWLESSEIVIGKVWFIFPFFINRDTIHRWRVQVRKCPGLHCVLSVTFPLWSLRWTYQEIQTPRVLQQGEWWGWGSPRSSNTLCTAARWVVGGAHQEVQTPCVLQQGGWWRWGSPRSSNTLYTAARWVVEVGLTKKFKHPVYCSKVSGGGGAHQEVQTPCVLQQGGWWVGLTKMFKHPVYCSKVGGGGGAHQEVQTPALSMVLQIDYQSLKKIKRYFHN